MTQVPFDETLTVFVSVFNTLEKNSVIDEQIKTGNFHFPTPLIGVVLHARFARSIPDYWLQFNSVANTAHGDAILRAAFYKETSPKEYDGIDLKSILGFNYGKLSLADHIDPWNSWARHESIWTFSGCGSVYVSDSTLFLSEIKNVRWRYGYRGSLYVIKGEELSEPQNDREKRLLDYTLEHRQRIFDTNYFYLPIPTRQFQTQILGAVRSWGPS